MATSPIGMVVICTLLASDCLAKSACVSARARQDRRSLRLSCHYAYVLGHTLLCQNLIRIIDGLSTCTTIAFQKLAQLQ